MWTERRFDLGERANPWIDLPSEPPYILDSDAFEITEFNNRVSDRFRLHAELYPEPFLGSPDAPIVLLNLNPGFAGDEQEFHEDQKSAKILRSNLTHSNAEFPFLYLDQQFESPGTRWWSRRLRKLSDRF